MSVSKSFLIALFTASWLTIPASPASARCPAGESGCTIDNAADKIKERVDQGARDVGRANSVADKAKEVRETVKDCIKCGTDAVKDGFDRVKSK